MEVLVVLFLLFLFSSLGDNKKKAQRQRENQQRAFRQMQEEMERQEAEQAQRMSADQGQWRATEMEREKQQALKQRLQQQAAERVAAAQAPPRAEDYRPPQPTVAQRAQVAYAHATEESSACTDDWAEEVRLHARPPRAQAPAAAGYAAPPKTNPYAALFTEQGLRNGVVVSEILGSRGGRHGRRVGR